MLWPFRVCHGVNVPFWVREGEDELWVKLSELDRAAYYYIRVNEGIENITGRIEVSYTNLLEKPSETIEGLADNLGLEFGTLTKQIVDQIYLTHPDRDYMILSKISSHLRDKVLHYSELSC